MGAGEAMAFTAELFLSAIFYSLLSITRLKIISLHKASKIADFNQETIKAGVDPTGDI